MTCTFNTAVTAAQFVAELVRQGVTFRMTQDGDETFVVTLTGGF